jgi:murein DD-endopeptidase MepM/ murein hydrolase activator NlpD
MMTNTIHLHKKYYCLFILVFFVLTIITGCNGSSMFARRELKASLINEICITDKDNNSSIITDENEIALFIEAFNTAKTDEMTISHDKLSAYSVTLKGKDEKYSEDMTMYVDKDLDNKNIFILSDSILKKADDVYFGSMLSNAAFDSLYAYKTPPVFYLVYNSEKILMEPYSYEWSFKKADSNYHNSNKSQTQNKENTSLMVTDLNPLNIDSAIEPDSIKIELISEDETVFSTTDIQNDLCNIEDGSYQCLLELQWYKKNISDFFGKVFYKFDLQIDNPPEFEISADKIYPGELLVITARNINPDENVEITSDFDFKPNIFGEGSQKVILLPVSYYHKEGKTYSISISAGNSEQVFDVDLLKKDFITQYLTIDTKVAAATRNDKSAQEVVDKIDPLRPVCDPVKYWEGNFIQPVDGGRVTATDFGKRRYVNNAPTSYRHNGLDIGQDEGTPIKASNNGRVLLAEYLIGTGYTVIIEHGYGLKTWYYHMVSLNCEKDDMVKKGDIIGFVGNTGFSTCPHLHFSTSVNNVYINPLSLIEEGVPLQ